MRIIKPIVWTGSSLKLLDQTCLPATERYVECYSGKEVVAAIKNLVVRGAPAIGVAAAFGLALSAQKVATKDELWKHLHTVARDLLRSRPTAVNLFWAVKRITSLEKNISHLDLADQVEAIAKGAEKIYQEDIENNKKIGEKGAKLLPDKANILTHCNAGALATAGFGTALGVIRAAHQAGKKIHVFVDETRPVLQGSRLTAWELCQEGIDATLITDNCAGFLMKQKKIDFVIVGADRIAANGDVANKIGTYSLAVLAKEHNIPFIVAAPLSTIDFETNSGDNIVLEERSEEEIKKISGIQIAPEKIKAYNISFDITPAKYITFLVTEKKVISCVNEISLSSLKNGDIK